MACSGTALDIQLDGKQRTIDNARNSGHAHHATLSETLSTVNVDFVAALARHG